MSAIASLPAGTSERRSSTCCERILRVAGGEHEELRVEALERLLELLAPGDLEDELDTGAELEILVAGADDARVAGRAGRSEDRQRGRRANRVDARRRRAAPPPRRASAACASLRSVHGDDSEIPSPSEMAWLRRLGPVTRGHCSGAATVRTVRARVAIALLLAALPAGATAAVPPALVGTAGADFLAGREGSDRIVARAGQRPDRRGVRRRLRPDLVRPGTRHRRRRRPRPRRCRLRGRQHAHPPRPAPERRQPARVGGRARLAHRRRDDGRPCSRSGATARAAPPASASRPRETRAGPGVRGSCPV